MHCHQSIWKDNKPLFAGSGFEAPVLLAYSSRNRSASCRIPYVNSPKGKRVEVRFPDPSANPYLAFAAMLTAGLDCIQNKIHPGDPMDKNLYDLPPEELSKVPTVAGSLRKALNSLDADRTSRPRSSTRCTIRSDLSLSDHGRARCCGPLFFWRDRRPRSGSQ